MSLTDEGHYGPKQLNMLKVIWGEGYLSPGGSEEIDEIIGELDLSNKKNLRHRLWNGWRCLSYAGKV